MSYCYVFCRSGACPKYKADFLDYAQQCGVSLTAAEDIWGGKNILTTAEFGKLCKKIDALVLAQKVQPISFITPSTDLCRVASLLENVSSKELITYRKNLGLLYDRFTAELYLHLRRHGLTLGQARDFIQNYTSSNLIEIDKYEKAVCKFARQQKKGLI